MSSPHTCPTCSGTKKVSRGGFATGTGPDTMQTCPTCAGSGVVWDHGVQESRSEEDRALDLTDYPA